MDYKLKESDLIGTLEGYPLEIAQLYYDTTVKSGKTKNVLQSIQEEPSFGFHWGSDENGMKGINWSGIRYHKRFESYYKVFPKIEENTERYQEGTIVYPTYEGFKKYSNQFSNSISGEVIKTIDYEDWVNVKWSNNKENSYPGNCITTDFYESVYVTHREECGLMSKFNENLPGNIVKEIWLNVGNKIDNVLSFTKGSIVECFLFKDSKQGESFWYEFSKHYNMSRFDECIEMFKELDKPKDETFELSDDYWINYKLKESDLIDCLKGYPLDIAQHYYDLCVKYCDIRKSKILTRMQNQSAYGFAWSMEPEGFDWYTVRIRKNFKDYYEHFKKTSKVENENTSGPKWSYKHDMFNKDNVSELSVHAVSYTHEDTKDSLEGEPKVSQFKMKRFKKNKTMRPVKKVSVEVNVKR